MKQRFDVSEKINGDWRFRCSCVASSKEEAIDTAIDYTTPLVRGKGSKDWKNRNRWKAKKAEKVILR